MNEGDVLLAALRQADGAIKDRPVLFLRRMPPFDDFLVCGISTELQHAATLDERISPNDADFRNSGLKSISLIRLGYLAVLPRSEFKGRIGSVPRAPPATTHQPGRLPAAEELMFETSMARLQFQQPPLHCQPLRGRETAEQTAGGEHAMAGHHERIAILRHHLADRAGGARRTARGGQLAVASRPAGGDAAAGLHNAATEGRQVPLVDGDVAKTHIVAGRVTLQPFDHVADRFRLLLGIDKINPPT